MKAAVSYKGRLFRSKKRKDRFSSYQNYAQYEYELAKRVIIPLLKRWGVEFGQKRLLDIGCGLGGGTIAFSQVGSTATGLDIRDDLVREARSFARARKANTTFVKGDVCSENIVKRIGKHEIVILRDVMEHIPKEKRNRLLSNITKILTEKGICFVSFPPYFSPFGGHQQHPRSVISFLPYVHLLPLAAELRLIYLGRKLRRRISTSEWNEFLDWRARIRKQKVTIASFESLASICSLDIARRELYLTRPAFSYRYGLPVAKNLVFGKIPFMRDLTTTGALYLLRRKSETSSKHTDQQSQRRDEYDV